MTGENNKEFDYADYTPEAIERKKIAVSFIPPNPKPEIVSPAKVGLNGLDLYEPYRITDLTEIPEPSPRLFYNDEVISPIEDLTTISGAPKSGKTAVFNIFISQSLSTTGTIEDGLDGYRVAPNNKNHAVIHFETEQARHKHQKNLVSILNRAGHKTCPENFLSYNIRKMNLDEYQDFTLNACREAFSYFGGIHSIWIDGGADFISDVNDPEQSNAAIKFFEDIAVSFSTAVFMVVHTNPNSTKERGHFGSQAQRKSGAILTVTIKDDVSTITPKLLRYAGKNAVPPVNMIFSYEKGYHVGAGTVEQIDDDQQKYNDQKKRAFVVYKETVSIGFAFKYDRAIDKIMSTQKIGERTAKDIFRVMRAEKMIIQGEDSLWRMNIEYKTA